MMTPAILKQQLNCAYAILQQVQTSTDQDAVQAAIDIKNQIEEYAANEGYDVQAFKDNIEGLAEVEAEVATAVVILKPENPLIDVKQVDVTPVDVTPIVETPVIDPIIIEKGNQ